MTQELTQEEREKQEYIEIITGMGFEFAGEELPENPEPSPRLVKVNLPDTEHDWKTGNGEGVWAYIRKEEDVEKYDKGEGSFEVILMNHSLYYMGLLYIGTVLKVDGRGPASRPVLNKEWITEKIDHLPPLEEDGNSEE